MATKGQILIEKCKQEEVYAVACTKCGEKLFKFSNSFFQHHDENIILHCSCGGVTEVIGHSIRNGLRED